MIVAERKLFPTWISSLFEAPLPEDFLAALKLLRVKN
jgi:hypothetical protein